MSESGGGGAGQLPEAPTIRSPFIEHLGIRFVGGDAEGIEMQLPILPEFLNSAGVVHGGVYASLADTALGAAIYAHMEPGRMALTMEMSCRYLRGARAGTLVALARVLHLGRSSAVAEAEVLVDGELQFKATGTFMLVARP